MKWILTSKSVPRGDWEDIADSIEEESDWVYEEGDLTCAPHRDHCVVYSSHLSRLAVESVVDLVLDDWTLEDEID